MLQSPSWINIKPRAVRRTDPSIIQCPSLDYVAGKLCGLECLDGCGGTASNPEFIARETM